MAIKKKIQISKKMNKSSDLSYFDIKLSTVQSRIILVIIVLLILILLFRKAFYPMIEKLIIFSILFLLLLTISKNILITLIASSLIFLLINLIMGYKDTLEKFQNLDTEPAFDTNVFNKDEVKKSADGIQDLLKKINGGIELKDDDTKESDPLNVDVQKLSDDTKPNALKEAQKETYALIDTVNALKDTITTLAPVLKEGKKLMTMFQDFKM
jgi:hypothetical protein